MRMTDTSYEDQYTFFITHVAVSVLLAMRNVSDEVAEEIKTQFIQGDQKVSVHLMITIHVFLASLFGSI
jgi:hypothetical protein